MNIVSKSVGRRLLSLSIGEDGLLDDNRMSCVLTSLLEQFSGNELMALLVEYMNALDRFIVSHTLYIEYSGELSSDSIGRLHEKYQAIFERPLSVVTKETKELIAGLRIRVDDFVDECSIANTLNVYRKASCM